MDSWEAWAGGFIGCDVSRVFQEGTVAGLYEDGFGFADGIGTAIVGEGEGDVFVGASCHFVCGAGIVVGEGHKIFDGCDGGLERAVEAVCSAWDRVAS